MGTSYWARTQHRFDEAKEALQKLPQNQRETGWALNQLARCYFDEQKYPQACDVYRKIQKLEPYRLQGLEYYSTCLYYAKDTTALSGTIFVFSPFYKLFQVLSSEFIQRARNRPETWCIAGNLCSVNQDHQGRIENFLIKKKS